MSDDIHESAAYKAGLVALRLTMAYPFLSMQDTITGASAAFEQNPDLSVDEMVANISAVIEQKPFEELSDPEEA